MTHSPQVPSRRTGLRPGHWIALLLGGVLVLFCGGVCGAVAVFGDSPDPSPTASVVAATEPASPSVTPSASETESPSATQTAAPLVGDAVPGAATGSETTGSNAAGSVPDPVATTRAAAPRVTTAAPRPATPKTTAPKPAPPKKSEAPAGVYYANCDAVRAAGAAPIHRGEPGYRAGLDRDDDGIGCE
ncbi:excalibur calcium-binding domain-containing protein [Cryptosporangium phraense]|uniref:Calcium-binding protein n=1 Tax=Cryptosporangium phraense TaxID=2593070 RepID=A0A545AHQ8_9ACTN|nr:excalibur calcium-binding domain-containing protein [Cryptosporangium phraense]TQS40862.1 calcium-binding protein [Cryptosporangium phraense]